MSCWNLFVSDFVYHFPLSRGRGAPKCAPEQCFTRPAGNLWEIGVFFDDLGWVYYRSHYSHYICHMSIYKLYNHILYIIININIYIYPYEYYYHVGEP